MTKLRLAAAALAAGAVTLVASPAMAYPDPVVNPASLTGTAADGVVASGEPITLAGDFGGTDCNPWVAVLRPTNQPPQSGSGQTFSVSFANPGDGNYTIAITCSYDDGITVGSGTAQQSSFSTASLATAAQTKVLTFAVRVGDAAPAPSDDTADGNGALPNTGGSSLWLAVAAGALVVAGATTYTVRRRTA